MNKRDKERQENRQIKEAKKQEDVETIKSVVAKYDLNELNMNKSNGKATSLVSYKRTIEVVKLILRGIRYTDIMEYCEAHWGIKRRQASIYYKKALESFADQFSEEREYEIDKHAIMLQDVAKMKGIVVDRVDVTSGGESFVFNYQTPSDKA